ncbi:unknown [Fusobacterium sp. CAG:439]|nr:unknown [Fusobacterium sp. CAG:439]
MCVHLRCIDNKDEPPFLRFQNDRKIKYNSNWVKMYIDGTLDNYENKKIVFTDAEKQALKDWINLNKEIIVKHYYQEYDSADVCKKIRKYKD